MAKCNSKNKGHKFAGGSFLGIDPITLAVKAGLAVKNAEGTLIQNAIRDKYNYLDPELTNALFTGENANQVINSIGTGVDFSNAKNDASILNSWDTAINSIPSAVTDPSGWEKFGDYAAANQKTLGNLDLFGYAKNQIDGFKNLFGLNDTAEQFNKRRNLAYQNTTDSADAAIKNNRQRQQREWFMNNPYAEGGSLEGLNSVTKFNYEVGKEYDVDENTYNKLLQLGYKIQVL